MEVVSSTAGSPEEKGRSDIFGEDMSSDEVTLKIKNGSKAQREEKSHLRVYAPLCVMRSL